MADQLVWKVGKAKSMMGSKTRSFTPLVNVSLEDLVPADHFYRHLERTLDLSFVREFVHETYAGGGRPSIDPVVFFKLQLVMFFKGIRSERQLMRHASDRLSVRWYTVGSTVRPYGVESRYVVPGLLLRSLIKSYLGAAISCSSDAQAGAISGSSWKRDDWRLYATAWTDNYLSRAIGHHRTCNRWTVRLRDCSCARLLHLDGAPASILHSSRGGQ